MIVMKLHLIAAAVVVSLPTVFAGEVPAPRPSRSFTSTSAGVGTPSSAGASVVNSLKIAEIKNRARVLGDKSSASRTRYVSITDEDLRGASTSQEVLKRLAPAPVKADQGIKRVEVVVDLEHPIFLRVPRDQIALVGTVLVEGRVNDLVVNSSIYKAHVTVTPK